MQLDKDTVRVYDVTDDGDLRVERHRLEHDPTTTISTTRVGRVGLEVLAAFPDDVPVIDLTECDDRTRAFAEELVA